MQKKLTASSQKTDTQAIRKTHTNHTQQLQRTHTAIHKTSIETIQNDAQNTQNTHNTCRKKNIPSSLSRL